MTTHATTRNNLFPTAAIATIFATAAARIANLFRARWEKRRERRRQLKAMQELRSLPNHMLRDIGINRSEIASVVTHGREGR